MHIAEGVLAWPVLAAGAGLAAAGTVAGLRRTDQDRIMTVAMLAAAFFVASLVHVPVGPVSMHLVLNGLLGLLLGWAAFPAILAGLVLQAVLFQYGGLTTLGVNTVTMAGGAVLCYYLFRPLLRRGGAAQTAGAFGCGAGAVAVAAVLTAACLALSDEGFMASAQVLVVGSIPIMIVEGLLSVFAVRFLLKVRPEMLQAATGR